MSNLISNLETIQKIKKLISQTRVRAVLRLNAEGVKMYFELGRELDMNILSNDGSTNIIREVSKELVEEFGKGQGYGERNLAYCIKFYRLTKDDSELHRLSAVVSWKSVCLVLDKSKTKEERHFYLNYALKNDLSKDMLEFHMKQDRFNKDRQTIPSNFEVTLQDGSEQLNEIISSEVPIEIFGAKKQMHERELENQIISNIKNFLINLGEGFCYIGNQNSFQYDGDEYITDLLFFNRNLKCLFAIELKVGKFKPEYLSKLQWYLHLLDTQMKLPDENRSIGIILCGSKDDYQVKTLLDDINAPIGVATHKLIEKIEKELINFLPKEELEKDSDASQININQQN